MQTGQIHRQGLDIGAILRRGERESIRQLGSRLGLTTGTGLHFHLIFGDLQANAWQIKHLHTFFSGERSLRKILVTVLTPMRRQQDRVVRLLHHPQGVPWMTGLPSTLFAALFSQTRRFANRFLAPVGRWGLTTIVAVLGCLSFQVLDASMGLVKTFQGLCQARVQGLLFGYLPFQVLDANGRLFKMFQGFCQVVAQGLIFGSLHFQFFSQFEGVHEATLPNFFLAFKPLGLLSSRGRKEAKQLPD